MYHEFRRPTILVIGATGAQGGGVARHLLADGRWTVRAFTRNPQSSAARTLRDAGVEIATGDLDDPASLRRAMVMCHGVHGITTHRDAGTHALAQARALRQARAIVDAAAAAGVKHLVLQASGAAPSADPLRVPLAWARERGVPVTLVRAAFHYENLLGHCRPRPTADGAWTLGVPHDAAHDGAPLATVSAEDVGGVIAAIFARREEHAGRTIGVVGDVLGAQAYADALARALGRRVLHGAAPCAPRAPYVARAGDPEESRRLYPRLRTFEQWVRVHARELGPVLGAGTPDAAAA
jgi:uncharacterized protein YbjT (DUF2867 family)